MAGSGFGVVPMSAPGTCYLGYAFKSGQLSEGFYVTANIFRSKTAAHDSHLLVPEIPSEEE
jgi:hypothetical protein